MEKYLFKIALKYITGSQKGVKPVFLKDHYFLESVPYLDIHALELGKVSHYANQKVAELTYDDEILVVWDGSRSGLVFKSQHGAVGSTLMRVKPLLIDRDFLYYFLKSNFENINENTTGSSIPHVDSNLFYNLQIPYATVEDQRRIVLDIENKYGAGLRMLNRQKEIVNQVLNDTNIDYSTDEDIEKSIKRFRNAVIEKAINGDLLKDSNVSHKNDWLNLKLEDVIVDKPKNGYSPKSVNFETKYKVLTLSATTSGVFDGEQFKYFNERVDPESDLWLKKGDILVQRGNSIDYVGVSAIYDGDDNEYIYPDLMIRLRPSYIINNKYFLLILSSESSRNYFRNNVTGSSSNMPKINQKTLMELPISLPSMDYQDRILDLVEELLTLSNNVLMQYKEAVSHVILLEKSILGETFRTNDLTTYETNDEFSEFSQKLDTERTLFLNNRRQLKKQKNQYIDESFIKPNELDKIKSKMKELALNSFSKSEFISPSEINLLRKQLSELVTGFDYDDFWSVFQELSDTNYANSKDSFFIAVEHNGTVHYKINNNEIARN